MRRPPILATLVVLVAVATMIALGVWQLQRLGEKEALIARYAANLGQPATSYPELAPVPAEAMFRRSQVHCLRVTGWRVEAGRSMTGIAGYRHIAECPTGAEGPGALIDLGVSRDPKQRVAWRGGIVDGTITTEPQHASLLGGLFGHRAVLRPMLVATTAAPGLAASVRPNPDDIPNNHRAYAVQWFVFAGVALLIYALALRRRGA